MGRRNNETTHSTNIISGDVIGSNIQTGPEGVTIGGVHYPDGIPENCDVINGKVVPRTN